MSIVEYKKSNVTLSKKAQLFRVFVFLLIFSIVGFAFLSQKSIVPQAKATDPWPDTPPVQICSNSTVLDGPSSAPAGAVTVAAGDNSSVNFSTANTTYYFAAGTHTIGSSATSVIQPGDNSTFIGAPGAIIDGQSINQHAFLNSGSNVTIEYLTVQNFVPPTNETAINVGGAPGWVIKYDTVQDNTPGSGVGMGTNNDVEYNCITHNGQLGINAYTTQDVDSLTGGPSNITVSNNEISYNDTYDYETNNPGCGCTGGAKFWRVKNATVDNNYVHHNNSVGLWADTNNDGFQFENNYLSDNAGQGIMYEISYNALIQNNNFINNAWRFGPLTPGFATGAIYISESGGDSRVSNSFAYSTISINNNNFTDNWGGVVLWENPNRFCSSLIDGTCTLVDPSSYYLNDESYLISALNNTLSTTTSWAPSTNPPAVGSTIVDSNQLIPSNTTVASVSGNTATISNNATTGSYDTIAWNIPGGDGGCSWGDLQGSSTASNSGTPSKDYYDNCRWKTQNVSVNNNTFSFTPSNITGCVGNAYCGLSGIFSGFGTYPSWSPYQGTVVEDAITYNQNNVFSNNTYSGPWQFMAHEQGNVISNTAWQASPYSQDAGSTFTGGATPTPTPTGGPTPTPTTAPTATPTPTPTSPADVTYQNLLDTDTSNLEGSAGHWTSWYSSTISQSSESAHTGNNSLKIDVTDSFWGVQLNNYPGFSATPGNKIISFWAKAGTGTSTPIMTVQWLDSSHGLLQTDNITMPTLTSSWQNVQQEVTAPSGTASFMVELNGINVGGDSLYVDDLVVGNYYNAVDSDNATFEGSIGNWTDWYSETASQSTDAAHDGTHSLKISVTGSGGWGVEANNYPGFPVTSGTKRINYWAKLGSGSTISNVTLTAYWLDSSYGLLQTTNVPINSLTTDWQEGSMDMVAPTNAAYIYLTVNSGTGDSGDTIYIDDVSVSNVANALDTDSSNFENSIGHWTDWYSETGSQSTDEAEDGSHSLKVAINALYGWGVNLDNWPGFSTTPGAKQITYWAKNGSGSISNATLTVQWLDSSNNLLQTDTVPVTLSSDWQEVSNAIVAPNGTAKAYMYLTGSDGNVADTAYFDGFAISDYSN